MRVEELTDLELLTMANEALAELTRRELERDFANEWSEQEKAFQQSVLTER